jgi:hypothetical protein
MAQADYEIDGDWDGLQFVAAMNVILAAIQSSNAGPTAPEATLPGMLWLDTSESPAVLKRRNVADDDWISLEDEPEAGFSAVGASGLVVLTQSEYESLSPKDPDILYFVREDD